MYGGKRRERWRRRAERVVLAFHRLSRAVTVLIAELRCPSWLPMDSYVDSTVVNGSGQGR